MRATWYPGAVRVLGNSSGAHAPGAGPKILHHTTEGSSTAGALAAFRMNNSWPTMTAEWRNERLLVTQHMPVNVAARALAHPYGPETNRANVVQIEHVGFTDEAYRKRVGAHPSLAVIRWSPARFAAIGRLCRWIEAQTGCPPRPVLGTRWGSDHPPRLAGQEFFGARGHAGHFHAPGNVHWDPSGAFAIQRVTEVDDDVSRRLEVGLSGADVHALQAALRVRAFRCGRRDLMPTVDGAYGHETKRSAAFVAYVMGIGTSQGAVVNEGLSQYAQRGIRQPSTRTARDKAREVPRRKKLCKGN